MKYIFVVNFLYLPLILSINQEMQEQISNKLNGFVKNGIIDFQDKIYREFVLESPRPYHLFILYTVYDTQFDCTVCKQLESYIHLIAENAQSGEENNLYFGIAFFTKNQKAFALNDFSSVPHLVYYPPTEQSHQSLNSDKEIFNPSQDFMNYLNSDSFGIETLCSFILEKTGIQVEIYVSPVKIIATGLIVVLITVGIIVVAVLHFNKFLSVLQNKNLWFILSMTVFSLSISGMIYCVINNSRSYIKTRSGVIQYFTEHGDDQFIAEGFIIALLNLLIAFSIISLTTVIKLKRDIARMGGLVLSLGGFSLGYWWLFQAYIYKNSWYASRTWYGH